MENNQITITQASYDSYSELLDALGEYTEQGYRIQHSYKSDTEGQVYILDKQEERTYTLEELKIVFDAGFDATVSFEDIVKTLN